MFTDIFPGVEYTAITSGSTPTTVKQIPLPEVRSCYVIIKGDTENAAVDKTASFFIDALFFRASGGDVTENGNNHAITVKRTAGTTMAVSIVANTTDQTIDVKVTGEVGETYTWRVKIEFIINP